MLVAVCDVRRSQKLLCQRVKDVAEEGSCGERACKVRKEEEKNIHALISQFVIEYPCHLESGIEKFIGMNHPIHQIRAGRLPGLCTGSSGQLARAAPRVQAEQEECARGLRGHSRRDQCRFGVLCVAAGLGKARKVFGVGV